MLCHPTQESAVFRPANVAGTRCHAHTPFCSRDLTQIIVASSHNNSDVGACECLHCCIQDRRGSCAQRHEGHSRVHSILLHPFQPSHHCADSCAALAVHDTNCMSHNTPFDSQKETNKCAGIAHSVSVSQHLLPVAFSWQVHCREI